MKRSDRVTASQGPAIPNGSGVAAILSAGIGCMLLAVWAVIADGSTAVRNGLNFYKPSGPLSGVTTTAILAWLGTWGILEWRWRNRTVPVVRIIVVALTLLALSFLLTFPPLADLVLGK